MTRKHFIMIAKWMVMLKKVLSEEEYDIILTSVLFDLRDNNQNFDKQRFLDYIYTNSK